MSDKVKLHALLVQHGNAYELANFIREYYDETPDEHLEPILFRLCDLLLPEKAST